jgi:hypothetical protein
MNSNLDPHQQLEEWLVDGAANDPPREMAFHASMCEECLARLAAFDSLGAVDVSAAGSPPPLAAPTALAAGIGWARLVGAATGGILALILVLAGASQLIGFVGDVQKPDASLVAVATETEGGPIGTFGPRPATEPSPSTGPTPTPIPTFIPLPTVNPAAAPLDFPNAPFVSVQGVSQTSVTIGWYPSSYGGQVQKWEIWRAAGGGGWFKLGELYPGYTAYADGGLSPDTVYSYRLRAVNTTGYSDWSNVVSPRTTALPTPAPTVGPTPTQAPTDTPPPATDCNDGINNDTDGLVDLADPGCADSSDTSELNPGVDCDDGANNDTDGLADMNDPGCTDPTDISELSGGDCDDGTTNDSDVLADMNDPGCTDPTDISELNPAIQCDNGADDDLDGPIDMADLGCADPTDNDEDPLVTALPLGPLLAGLAIWRLRKRREAERDLIVR